MSRNAILHTLGIVLMNFISLNSSYGNDLNAFPKLKSGEWQMTVKNDLIPKGMPAMLSEMKMIYCIDEATQDKLITQSEEQSECAQPKVEKIGNKFISDFECAIEGQQFKGHAETTFVSDTQIDNRVSMSGPGQPKITLTSNAKYSGACKAGMKAGDMRMLSPSGSEISLDDVEELKKMGDALSQFDSE